MGQKVNPKGFRVGVIKDWDARWYANNKDFKDFLYSDYQLRSYVKEEALCLRCLQGGYRAQGLAASIVNILYC